VRNRAACTRDAIRDFFDLEQLLDASADLTSNAFRELVDVKLEEIAAAPLREQKTPFGLTPKRRRDLQKSAKAELPAILRTDTRSFDLEQMLSRFQGTWDRLVGGEE
jgi:hypothetical protein